MQTIKQIISVMCNKIQLKYDFYMSKRAKQSTIQPNIRGTDETIDALTQNGKISASRLGDGEFAIIFGESINYQRYDKALAEKLKSILHSNIENHIVCISDVFGDMEERSKENREFWEEHLNRYRYKYYKYIDMNKTYYNTSASRVYKLLENKVLASKRFEKWKRLWNNQDIVFIEGKDTRCGIGNDLFSNAHSIHRIICPSENAFDCYNKILDATLKCDKNCLFILALGPTATALSYDMAKLGLWAVDLGHIDIEYEWYLRGNSNITIDGKYVNEVAGGSQVSEMNSDEYTKQILYVIENK